MNSSKLPICCTLNFLLLFFACGQTTSQKQVHPSQAQTEACDNPDAEIHCCFLNMPDSLTSILTIPTAGESANKLIISGTVFKADGKTPYPQVVLYAYHTDS